MVIGYVPDLVRLISVVFIKPNLGGSDWLRTWRGWTEQECVQDYGGNAYWETHTWKTEKAMVGYYYDGRQCVGRWI
jgi:hypothetical protein